MKASKESRPARAAIHMDDLLGHAADDIALDALMRRSAPIDIPQCDCCGEFIEGEPSSRGLLIWAHDEERLRAEEPPLCEECTKMVGLLSYGLLWNLPPDGLH